MHIIIGKDELLARWAAAKIPAIGDVKLFGQYKAVGVATGTTAEDRLLAVCVYHDFQPKYETCQISFAAADPRWVARQTVRALLSVPFLQYRVNKVWVAIPHTSERTIRLVKALGFRSEATLTSHFGRGVHAVVCRMFSTDYEKLYFRRPGQAKAA